MQTYCNTLPGYSWHRVSKSSMFFHLGPTTIKTNSSLSQLTLTLSRYSLSLSLPQEPSLSPNPRTQKSPSQINPKTKKAQISVGDHLLQVFHHGVASFLSFLARRVCSRYYELGQKGIDRSRMFKSISFGSIISLWTILLEPERVSNFVGWFCQNQDFSFWGENGVKPGDSGYKPEYSGFGTLREKLQI